MTHDVDVLVIGSGGGGMTAALAAHASGLETLVVEKSGHFGGSTALSGGGIWVPGAPAQLRAGYAPPPDGVVDYMRRITDGLVSDARIQQYVDSAPEMMEFLEQLSPWFEFVWKPGYADYYPELPGGSELGSTINVPPIDLRTLAEEEQHLLAPLALAPRGIWLGPKELRSFYQVRQSWAGKGVLVKLVWRMIRARVFGDRIAAIGQSLAARLRLAMKDRGIPLWLDSPMIELLTGDDGSVTGAAVVKDGSPLRIYARRGSSWRPADSTTTSHGAKSTSRPWNRIGASATPRPPATGSAPARKSAPPPNCSTRLGGFRPSNGRMAECNSCSTSA